MLWALDPAINSITSSSLGSLVSTGMADNPDSIGGGNGEVDTGDNRDADTGGDGEVTTGAGLETSTRNESY